MKNLRLRDNMINNETLLKYSCGPNFVLNREAEFRSMIRQQGMAFWFRLWLIFCRNPGCDLLKALAEQWPKISCWAYICLHHQFLKGSADDAAKFCLDKAIYSLKRAVKKEDLSEELESKQAFKYLLRDYTEMMFGCVMCVTFYKWTYTYDEISRKESTYWNIPKEYLKRSYKPGMLEEFCVKEWKGKILSLLGIEREKIPRWIVNYLHDGPLQLDENLLGSAFLLYSLKIAKVMREKRNEIRRKIETFDEKPQLDMDNNLFGLTGKLVLPAKSDSSEMGYQMSSIGRHICSFCKTVENIFTRYKICPECVEQHWKIPRYYCCDDCQVEHWFQTHCNDHKIKSPAKIV